MSQDFNYQEALLQCKTMEDITGKDGLVQKIIKDAVEHILGQELEDYISQKNSSGDKVSRNGSTTKILQTKFPRRQRTGTAGHWTAFTRLYSLTPCILKSGRKAVS